MIIPLTQGKAAIIDDADYPLIKCYRWYARKCRWCWYATANVKGKDGKWRKMQMHHLILGAVILTDHRNGDGLDNRRINLRPCTHAENVRNSTARHNSRSPYKGVSWDRKSRKWKAQIGMHGRKIHLGFYEREQDAAEAYDMAARRYFGEFARLNCAA